MKKIFIYSLIAIFLFTISPTYLIAQTVKNDICARAEADAVADTNKVVWGAVGCLLGLIGILIASLIPPSPPAARLMGKSSDYITVYTECYKEIGGREQRIGALIGCGLSSLASFIAYFIILSAVSR